MVEVIGQCGKPSIFKIVQCILKYYRKNITALKLYLISTKCLSLNVLSGLKDLDKETLLSLSIDALV